MGKVYLNHTGKLPFFQINTETARNYYCSYCPQKFIDFNEFNNNIIIGDYLFYKTYSEQVTGKLHNMTSAKYMFYQDKNLKKVKLETPNLETGDYMFYYCTSLDDLDIDTSKLTSAKYMFTGVPVEDLVEREKFNYNLLTNGTYTFYNTPIKKVQKNFDSLTIATGMFCGCGELTTVESSFPLVEDGYKMFSGCSKLEAAPITPNLTDGQSMYYGCSSLTEFTHDLSNMTYAPYMFQGCTNLRVFTSTLSLLGTTSDAFPCQSMFDGCKLNKASLIHLFNQLMNIDVYSSSTYIVVGGDKDIALNPTDRAEIMSYFSEIMIDEGGASTVRGILPTKNEKSWLVALQWN